MKSRTALPLYLGLALSAANLASAETVWLDSLNVAATTQGWGDPHKNKSVEGNALTIGGKMFEHGLGTHAESILHVKLDGGAETVAGAVVIAPPGGRLRVGGCRCRRCQRFLGDPLEAVPGNRRRRCYRLPEQRFQAGIRCGG